MGKNVYWHLPGLTVNFYLNQVLINLMKEHPDKFKEDYKIGSVYGTFPGAIWNGGRAVLGSMTMSTIDSIIKTYNRLEAPVRFTWTNSCLEEKHIYDTYCNLIMGLANNGMNQVLCNSEVLEDYLRKEYPDFEYVSSTTKRIKSIESFKEELKKDYFMVVLDYDLNHDEETLKSLEDASERVEILVDEICYPDCPKRVNHYRQESIQQLSFDKGKPFECPNIKTRPSFAECMKRPSFISDADVDAYVERGFVNYKLIGRGLPEDLIVDSYMYYLVKEEHRDFIRNKLLTTVRKLKGI